MFANVDAKPNAESQRVAELLVRQVDSPVLWDQTIAGMAESGVLKALEIGPGKILATIEVDIERPPGTGSQLTFGWGVHHCLGAALARAELQEALPVLARATPDLCLDGPVEWKPPTAGIWGPSRLPLRFGPGGGTAADRS